MIKRRIPAEHYAALDRVLTDRDWNVIVRYLVRMPEVVEKRLLDAPSDANLVYLKGKVDGAREIAAMIQDFKNYFRDYYSDAE